MYVVQRAIKFLVSVLFLMIVDFIKKIYATIVRY